MNCHRNLQFHFRNQKSIPPRRTFRLLENLGQDIQLAVRLLIKTPGFTIIATLTLTLGIGVNLMLFTLLNSQFLSPRAVLRPGEIWSILPSDASGQPRFFHLSRPYYEAIRQYNRVFKDIAGLTSVSAQLLTSEGPEELRGFMVSGNYFDFLGTRPLMGRSFLSDENDKPGMHSVAVISYEFWQRFFNGDAAVLGKTLTFRVWSGTLVLEVVGVAPPGFLGMGSVPRSFWVPASREMESVLGYPSPTYKLFGRLDSGKSASAAADALGHVVRDVTKTLHSVKYALGEGPSEANNNSNFVRVSILRAGYGSILPEWIDHSRNNLIKLNSLAAFGTLSLLLMAAFNLANLLFARALNRRREMATRFALGAPRWALVRQLTVEGILIALAATVGALMILNWFGNSAPKLLSAVVFNPDATLNFHTDVRVAAFSIITALLSGVGCSLLPALFATRFDPFVVLKKAHAGLTESAGQFSVRKLLVVLQVAGSLVLLSGVSLSLRGIQRQLSADIGFPPDHLIVSKLNLEKIGYTITNAPAACAEMRQQIASIPGVETVGLIDRPPFFGGHNQTVTDHLSSHEGTEVRYFQFYVGPESFHSLGIPLMAGREISPADLSGNRHVVLVNESFVRKFWPGEAVLGKHIDWIKDKFEVVGVVRDARLESPTKAAEPTVYMAMPPYFALAPTFIIRTKPRSEFRLSTIRAELTKFHPRLSQSEIFTMREAMKNPLAAQQKVMKLLGEIAAVALGLTLLGTYGLMSYIVTQRTHEIGVRLAIGAHKSDLANLFLRYGTGIAFTGILTGIPFAYGGSLFLRHFIFEIPPLDLTAFAIAILSVLLTILIACALPAHRATLVDPIKALRFE
jgi:putative ABC transport system permease protein